MTTLDYTHSLHALRRRPDVQRAARDTPHAKALAIARAASEAAFRDGRSAMEHVGGIFAADASLRPLADAAHGVLSLWRAMHGDVADEIATGQDRRRRYGDARHRLAPEDVPSREECPDCWRFVRTCRAGFVYVMRDGPLCKIGMSVEPRTRASVLGHEIALTIPTACARSLEKRMHERFAACRVRGEYFRLSAFDLDAIAHEYGATP